MFSYAGNYIRNAICCSCSSVLNNYRTRFLSILKIQEFVFHFVHVFISFYVMSCVFYGISFYAVSMLAPGFLSRKVQGIEKEKQQTIEQLITKMHAAGIENPSKFFFRSNQQRNSKGTDKRKNKLGRGDGDEDSEAFNGEEGLSDDDDENDDSSRSKAKKVKRTATGKKNGGSTAQEEGSSPHEATQALQLPTPPTEHTDLFSSPHVVIGSVVHEARTTMSKKPTRKRGPTKLKTIAIDGGSRIKVLFNEKGIPIGEGSVKLSSFSGALVREIVPYTLSDWRKLPSSAAEVLWKSI